MMHTRRDDHTTRWRLFPKSCSSCSNSAARRCQRICGVHDPGPWRMGRLVFEIASMTFTGDCCCPSANKSPRRAAMRSNSSSSTSTSKERHLCMPIPSLCSPFPWAAPAAGWLQANQWQESLRSFDEGRVVTPNANTIQLATHRKRCGNKSVLPCIDSCTTSNVQFW